jgi:hypothetical protein
MTEQVFKIGWERVQKPQGNKNVINRVLNYQVIRVTNQFLRAEGWGWGSYLNIQHSDARPGRCFVSQQLPLHSTATLAALPDMSLAPVAPFTCNFGLTSARGLDGRNAFTPEPEDPAHPN